MERSFGVEAGLSVSSFGCRIRELPFTIGVDPGFDPQWCARRLPCA
jgi:hypothetical protein